MQKPWKKTHLGQDLKKTQKYPLPRRSHSTRDIPGMTPIPSSCHYCRQRLLREAHKLPSLPINTAQLPKTHFCSQKMFMSPEFEENRFICLFLQYAWPKNDTPMCLALHSFCTAYQWEIDPRPSVYSSHAFDSFYSQLLLYSTFLEGLWTHFISSLILIGP